MVTIKEAKKLADRIVSNFRHGHIDRIILFGSTALQERGNDIDIAVIIKSNNGKSQDFFYNEIQRRIVSPFIKEEAIGVDLFVWDFDTVLKHNKNVSPFLNLIARKGRVLFMAKNYLKDWFRYAREDYEMAEILLEKGYFRGSCIHAQQAMEKCLKGLLIKNRWELERTHSIGSLVAFTSKYNIPIDLSDDDIEFIDRIYRGRYPAEDGLLPFGEPDKDSAIKAIKIASNVLKLMPD